MSHLEGQRSPLYYYYEEPQTYVKTQQIISTVALLLLGYFIFSFFDVWPSTTKRTLYETTIRLIPSRFIYFLQYIMKRLGRLSDHECLFRREDFGSFKAKEEALQRMVGESSIPSVLHRARTLSGYDKFMPTNKEIGPPGLGNWDNSCYQNSILQGLASLTAFQHFIHRSLLLCEKTNVARNTTDALAVFLDQLSDATCHKQTMWTPKILKSMDSWQQQDAQEYFSRILEAVEKEAIQYTKVIGRRLNPGLRCLQSGATTSDVTKAENVGKLLKTLVQNPMDGMFAQALTCQTCRFSEGVSLNLFNCLTVNLGLGCSRSLTDLLDEYTEPELIEGVECDNCTKLLHTKNADEIEEPAEPEDQSNKKDKDKEKALRVKEKQITFGRLPKNLVIHVNRSIWDEYGNQIKNPSFVQFPSRLNFLGRWCAPLEAESESIQATYELKCIVTHSGRHDNGHYVAYGKRDKDWYCFNDEIVTRLSEQQVLTRGNVFMMFYEAIDRTDLMTTDEAEGQADEVHEINEATIEDGRTSPSPSSTESEEYEESMVNPSQVPVPVMRTASGGIIPDGTRGNMDHPYVAAV